MDGSTRTESYLQINPKGRVPVLETDNLILTEASAILTYLALKNNNHAFIENTPTGIARSIEWTNWLSSGIHALPITQNLRPERLSENESCHHSIQAKGMNTLIIVYSEIEQRLSKTKWAIGDSYSIVDPYLLVFYRWGNRLGLIMQNQYIHWTRHANQMLKRNAVKEILINREYFNLGII